MVFLPEVWESKHLPFDFLGPLPPARTAAEEVKCREEEAAQLSERARMELVAVFKLIGGRVGEEEGEWCGRGRRRYSCI